MPKNRNSADLSELLQYLLTHTNVEGNLPSLTDLAAEIGISVATLREQLEAARMLGLVEARPRTGTKRLPYSFTPAVRQSLMFALALNEDHFQEYSELRNHIEVAYWTEAAQKLTRADKNELQNIVTRAWNKLRGKPAQVPHEEHRQLHLLIYSRLNNPFVAGLLEAYWDAYEIVGLNVYAGGMDYLEEVWGYHAQMVEAIRNGNFEAGRDALVKHIGLLAQRPS